jgi:hypothetical protein
VSHVPQHGCSDDRSDQESLAFELPDNDNAARDDDEPALVAAILDDLGISDVPPVIWRELIEHVKHLKPLEDTMTPIMQDTRQTMRPFMASDSTFKDWGADMTGYRRSDALEKRKLMEAWASYCEPKKAGTSFR